LNAVFSQVLQPRHVNNSNSFFINMARLEHL